MAVPPAQSTGIPCPLPIPTKYIESFSRKSSGIEFARFFVLKMQYGAFSVSASNAEAVRHYIEHQAEHHAKHSFEDEFVSLLRKSNVAYDPQFVFG